VPLKQRGLAMTAFARGLLIAFSVPAFVLFATALGFGALARDSGFTMAHTAFMAATMFALPNQVVLVDQLARGATLAAAALAVTLAAVRLFPMVATLAPAYRGTRRRPILEFVAGHFVAITSWIEGNRRLSAVPVDLRLPFHLGMGVSLTIVMLSGSLAGHALAGTVPPLVSAALLFTTPLYFILSLVATSGSRMDLAAVVLGCGLAPALYLLVPDFDLLATGLIGGTAAFLWGRRTGSRAIPPAGAA
jgi:predicted branched-subunit amino acid permease